MFIINQESLLYAYPKIASYLFFILIFSFFLLMLINYAQSNDYSTQEFRANC